MGIGIEGKRGMIAFCPVCGSSSKNITWDPETDTCTCACGWTDNTDREKQKDKQIDTIAKIIMTAPPIKVTVAGKTQGKSYYTARHIAKHLVESGVAQHRERYLLKENGEIVPLTPRSEWISVEERLPNNCRSVLVALKGLTIGGAPSMVIGSYSGGFWMIADADGTHYLTKYMRCEVTHWMPLPDAPKMKGGE